MADLRSRPRQADSRAFNHYAISLLSLLQSSLASHKAGSLIWKRAKLYLNSSRSESSVPSSLTEGIASVPLQTMPGKITQRGWGRAGKVTYTFFHFSTKKETRPCPGPLHRGNKLSLIFEIIQPWQLGENSGPRSKRWEGMKQGQNVIKRSQMFGPDVGSQSSLCRFTKTHSVA